jgi:hypothetical protein
MASLAKSLKTDSMSDMDLKALAQVLRSRGRGKDTVLAHITPEEAKLLKARGGRGSRNPDTGLLEFDDDFGGAGFDMPAPEQLNQMQQNAQQPAEAAQTFQPQFTQAENPVAQQNFQAGGISSPPPQGNPVFGVTAQPGFIQPSYPQVASAAVPAPGVTTAGNVPQAATDQPSWAGRQVNTATDWLTNQKAGDVLGLGGRVGVAGLGGLLGMQQQAQLQKQGKQAAAQVAALGAPQQKQGADLIAQAQRGEMSAQSQQAYEAARAQLQQQVAQTGGVGAAQAAAQLETLRNSLLNNQYQLGLQVSGIGNQYALSAIQQGLQSNQQAAQLSQQYWQALSQALAGSPTMVALQPQVRQ